MITLVRALYKSSAYLLCDTSLHFYFIKNFMLYDGLYYMTYSEAALQF